MNSSSMTSPVTTTTTTTTTTPKATKDAKEPTDLKLSDMDEITKKLSIPSTKSVNVTNYFNDRYPTQQTLISSLPSLDDQLLSVEQRVESDLTMLIRTHRNDSEMTMKSIEQTKQSSSELNTTLLNLTNASETVHENLSQSLQSAIPIYTALTNVSQTLEALDALVLLDESVNKLESCVQSSNLNNLANHSSLFKDISHSTAILNASDNKKIKGLNNLYTRATIAKESIRSITLNSFKIHSDAISHMDSVSSQTHEEAIQILSSACVITDAMGLDVRAEVIGSFVKRRRSSFKVAFTYDTILTSIDKRFSWIIRELRNHWTHLAGERIDKGWGRVFPKHWHVDRKLTDGLILECKDSVCYALDNGQAEKDVNLMILALKKSKNFEADLDRRFSANIYSADNTSSFVGNISDCFGPWMNSFVNHEDDHLSTIIKELVENENWALDNNGDTQSNSNNSNNSNEAFVILKSATELFLVIKKSMNTCASLDVRQPLFSLHRIFRKHLTTYASVLVRNLPGIQRNSAATTTSPQQLSKEFETKLKKACLIINTSYYCSTTTEQLEESIKKIISSVFENDIDMNNERERFNSVCVKGIQSILLLIEDSIETDIKTISNKEWINNIKTVGDTSKYIEDLNTKLNSIIQQSYKNLSNYQHFRFLLEKLANSILLRIKFHLYQLESISNIATQQLLLDFTTLKGFIIALPSSVNSATSTTFVKFVNREVAKIEAILKVILAPLSSSVDTYVTLVGDLGFAEDFQKVLQIKGLTRAEAAPLVLEYSRRIGPSQRLKPVVSNGANSNNLYSTRTGFESRTEAARRKVNSSQIQQQQSHVSGLVGADAVEAAGAAVDSVKTFIGRWGSSIMETGADGIGKVSSQLESTTDKLMKKDAVFGSKWSLFGNK